MHYLLMYTAAADYLERRKIYRAEHLALAWASHLRGELILGGALGEPIDSSVLFFQGDSSAAAEAFARTDPYVIHGVVTRWVVRPWLTVVGEGSADPVRPG